MKLANLSYSNRKMSKEGAISLLLYQYFSISEQFSSFPILNNETNRMSVGEGKRINSHSKTDNLTKTGKKRRRRREKKKQE